MLTPNGTTSLGIGALAVFVFACSSSAANPEPGPSSKPAASKTGATDKAPPPKPGLEVATFAGGCFWCMEPPFEKLSGVQAVYSGYTGGPEQGPSYKQVSAGRTGHTEAVYVVFDPDFVTYEELLDTFWRNIDPTDRGGQFVDRGSQYRTGIFVYNEAQKEAADMSKDRLMKSGRFKAEIVTPIKQAGDFWLAEDYHQDFYKKSSAHYYRYRRGSGRDDFIAKHWSK